MLTKTNPTYTVDIYMAGDIANAKQVCREYCFSVGLCVHVIAGCHLGGCQEACGNADAASVPAQRVAGRARQDRVVDDAG